MFDPGIERTVSVWGKPHKVKVYRKSKTVYTVTGDYMGRLIEGKGSSHRSAVSENLGPTSADCDPG